MNYFFIYLFYLCRPKFALVRSGEDIELGVASSGRTLVDVNYPQIYSDATGASAKKRKKKEKKKNMSEKSLTPRPMSYVEDVKKISKRED